MKPVILDFTESGNAILQLPNFGTISFLENFRYPTIKEIEADIAIADTTERADFLHRFLSVYKETFKSRPPSYLEVDEGSPYIEKPYRTSICFNHVKLLHSSAWYAYNRVSVEIAAVKKHLTEIEAQYVVADNKDEVVKIIRASISPMDARNNIKTRFGFTDAQAKYVIDTRLAKLTSWMKPVINEEKADYERRLIFLKKLL